MIKDKRNKHCKNCKHLEWIDGESFDPAGYICNGRSYRTDAEENEHLAKMEDDKYLEAPKKCCVLHELCPVCNFQLTEHYPHTLECHACGHTQNVTPHPRGEGH